MVDYGTHTAEFVRTFMIAAHQELDAVRTTLDEHPDLLNVRFQWAEGNYETPLGAASHVGNRPIAEYLLERGAPMTICTAAMLGRAEDVARFLEEDPAEANAVGAHNIPLLLHVALSGRADIAQMVVDYGGGGAGPMSVFLHTAVARGDEELVAWALGQGVDANARNYEGKSPLEVAEAQGNQAVSALLRAHGARSG
jgi:uncharacterized protein